MAGLLGPRRRSGHQPVGNAAFQRHGSGSIPAGELLSRAQGFAPIVGRRPHLLILGTLPGTRSIAAGEYYAHPQNQFWRLMEDLYGVARTLPYAARTAAVTRAGVAVWDVLHEAERHGSSDAAITALTARANAFVPFLRRHRSIRRVAFNGQRAAALFRRHVATTLPPDLAGLETIVLPSTSPAHAGLSYAEKLGRWSVLRSEGPSRRPA